MSYNDNIPSYSRRSSEIPTTIITAALTAAAVTVTVLFVTGNLKFSSPAASKAEADNAAASKDGTRQVPPLVGLSTDVAQEVLRARDLRLVVQGRRPDNNVKEGQIVEQDPLADSELSLNGAVSVIVSAGIKQTEVPNLIGKSLEEAKQMLASSRLTLKDVSETGTGAPGTVCESSPAAGVAIDEGAQISLVVAPTLTVPDVVGKYMGQAREEIEKAGFKVGKVRWRINDYKDANVVLSQEPVAGTAASPGDEINLFVNEE